MPVFLHRIIGNQVKILNDPVTVMGRVLRTIESKDLRREAYPTNLSQEAC